MLDDRLSNIIGKVSIGAKAVDENAHSFDSLSEGWLAIKVRIFELTKGKKLAGI